MLGSATFVSLVLCTPRFFFRLNYVLKSVLKLNTCIINRKKLFSKIFIIKCKTVFFYVFNRIFFIKIFATQISLHTVIGIQPHIQPLRDFSAFNAMQMLRLNDTCHENNCLFTLFRHFPQRPTHAQTPYNYSYLCNMHIYVYTYIYPYYTYDKFSWFILCTYYITRIEILIRKHGLKHSARKHIH